MPLRLRFLKDLLITFSVLPIFLCCNGNEEKPLIQQTHTDVSLMVLGIAQDAGFPQIQCKKSCCTDAFARCDHREMVACIALIDHIEKKYFLLDATPDMKYQMQLVEKNTDASLGGILLTHAHIGHYTGLMDLGREAMGADKVPVYAMPRMLKYLSNNGPWSQLVSLGNILLMPMTADSSVKLSDNIALTPHLVPHRDEFSETVGFHIVGIEKSGWFIPDIDKWDKWDRDLNELLDNDFLFIDGTFYRNGEIYGRDMSEIPHPFIMETMQKLESVGKDQKAKVHFIHFNHTNPAMWDSEIRAEIHQAGYWLAEEGMVIAL